jgi:hypothetical protein
MVPNADSPLDATQPEASRSPCVLSPAEEATLEALLERLFPADELGPGAIEIGVPNYLRLALAGPYAELAPVYHSALAGIDAAARREFGRPFVALSVNDQDSLVDRLEREQIEELQQSETTGFFDLVWQHLREGLFSDPIHGGNRDMLGWRLIGFPGAQEGYTAEEQRLDAVITRKPRSLADWPDPRRILE